MSEGKVLVSCHLYNENLSCSGYCPPITNLKYEQEKKEKIREELKKQAEEQRDKHVILPD